MALPQKPWPAAMRPPAQSHIRCPECGGITGVIDSRANDYGGITRHRSCVNGHRFTTTECFGDLRLLKEVKKLKPKLIEVMKLIDGLLLNAGPNKG